jgi:hypothetical protein
MLCLRGKEVLSMVVISKETLLGFQGRGLDEVVQPDFCHGSSVKPFFFNALKKE